MKKIGLVWIAMLLVGGLLFCKSRPFMERIREEARQRGLPALAWFEIQRALHRCGSATSE